MFAKMVMGTKLYHASVGMLYNLLTSETFVVNEHTLTAEDQRVCNKVSSAAHQRKEDSEKDELSKGIVQELVAPEVALQPADIQTVRVV